MNLKKLTNQAHQLRQKTFNTFIKKGEAHLGGSFSMIEFIVLLFESVYFTVFAFITTIGILSLFIPKTRLSNIPTIELYAGN